MTVLRFIPSFLLGAVSVAGFAPLAWYPLPILALSALMLIWRRAADPMRCAAHGYAFGLGVFGIGVSWVYVSLADFGGMPMPLAALATALFCAVLALYPAAVGFLQQRIGGVFGLRAMVAMPALWTFCEWLRDAVTGFPWLALGYSQGGTSPLAGYAPVGGVFFVSLMSAVAAGALAQFAAIILERGNETSGGRAGMPTALGLLLLCVLAGSGLHRMRWSEPAGAPLKVALLQGNVAQNLKFDEDWYDNTLATYRKLALESDAKLIVWPETAIPRLLHRVDADFLEDLRRRAAAKGADMLIGIPFRDGEANYYNSVFSLGASPTQSYSKTHLVPFGEFIPAGFDWILAILHIPMGNFARGSEQPPPLAVAGQKVAVNICYEDAFGEEIIRQLPGATMLVNVSNIAWFGHSIAPAQHLRISQMRALETARPMLRATNTGMTAAIDEKGTVIAVLPQFAQGTLVAIVQPQSGATPFVRWGNAPALALALALLACAAAFARRIS